MTLPVAIGLALQLLLTLPATSEEAQGDHAYLDADFDQALRHYSKAIAEAVNPSDRARLHLSRAVCFMALQDSAQATAALTEALENDPNITLDPERVAPLWVDRFSRLQSALRGSAAAAPQTVSAAAPEQDSAPSVPAKSESLLQAYAGLRLHLSGWGGLSPEADVRISYRWLRLEGGLLLGSSPAFVLRCGAQTPHLFSVPLSLHATLNGVLFSQLQFGLLGPGISAGASWTLSPRWTAILEWSGWQLYAARAFLNRYWTLSAAVQWRFG